MTTVFRGRYMTCPGCHVPQNMQCGPTCNVTDVWKWEERTDEHS